MFELPEEWSSLELHFVWRESLQEEWQLSVERNTILCLHLFTAGNSAVNVIRQIWSIMLEGVISESWGSMMFKNFLQKRQAKRKLPVVVRKLTQWKDKQIWLPLLSFWFDFDIRKLSEIREWVVCWNHSHLYCYIAHAHNSFNSLKWSETEVSFFCRNLARICRSA